MKMVPDHGNFRLKMLLRFDSSEHYTPRSLRRYERAKRISENQYVFGQNTCQNRASHGGEISPSFATFLLTDCRLLNVPKKRHVTVIDAGCGRGILLSHIAMARKNATTIGLEIDEDRCKLAKDIFWSTGISSKKWHILKRSFIPSDGDKKDIFFSTIKEQDQVVFLFFNNYGGVFSHVTGSNGTSLEGQFANEIIEGNLFAIGSKIITLSPIPLLSPNWLVKSYVINVPEGQFSWFSSGYHKIQLYKYTKIRSKTSQKRLSVRKNVGVIYL